jgi:hypothetical protein
MAQSGPKRVKKLGEGPIPDRLILGIGATVVLQPGMMTARNQDGYVVKFTAALGLRALGRYEGPSVADNTSGANAAFVVEIKRGCFGLENSAGAGALTVADINKFAYAVDDETVSRDPAGGTRPVMGTVVGFDGTHVMVNVGGEEGETRFEYRWLAGADLRLKQYFYVSLDANNKIVLTGAGGDSIGVLQNKPNTNELGVVCFYGPTRNIGGGAVTKGAQVASDAAGKAKAAVTGKTDTSDSGAAADALIASHVMGNAMETGVLDTEFAVFLSPKGAVPTTAA